jgi:hypothetical protein
MLSSYLYWFIYRRRNKFLILLMIIFCILFYSYHNDSSVNSQQIDKPKKNIKNRINRETYTTPEPCQGCPGENGQGVQLTVREK